MYKCRLKLECISALYTTSAIEVVLAFVHRWSLRLALTCLLGIIANAVAVPPPICGLSRFDRFHRSRFTRAPAPPDEVHDIKEFPFLVSIRTYIREDGEEEILINDGSFVGTLLDELLVLTSCICVANEIGQVGRAGPESLRDPTLFGATAGTLVDIHREDQKSQFRWGWKILVHPKCDISTAGARYNIAFLIVREAFKMTPDRVSVLPPSAMCFELPALINASCSIVGWGWEAYGYKFKLTMIEPPAKMELSIRCSAVADAQEESCASFFPIVAFTGDVGSPVMCTSNGNKTVVGIRTNSEESNFTHVTVTFVRFDDNDTKNWIDHVVKHHPTPRSGQVIAKASAKLVVSWGSFLIAFNLKTFVNKILSK